VAGWAGSALGIGMGQNLGHVPPAFVGAAGLVVLLPGVVSVLRYRARELGLTALVLGAALLLDRRLQPGPGLRPAGGELSAVERGRLVYISEGCIHCHSQYVRPGTADVLLWGPVTPLEEVRAGAPPLIGNRRQGPDLSQVGGRRSPLWLEAHFYSPAGVSGASIMPPYGFLFRDGRGQDLVAYLESLRAPDLSAHLEQERAWRPSARAREQASAAEGERLFRQDCAGCHSPEGRTRMAWAGRFREVPADLPRGPWRYVSVSEPHERLLDELTRITKFGIAGTDMPGHEYLPDREIASLGMWMAEAGSRTRDQAGNTDSTQEKKP
jgi:cytochrome c oxidase cbb3-type subunit 2